MQVKAITVNGTGMMTAGRSAQGKGQPTEQSGNMFGPEYKVTISRTGRNLSGLQRIQTEKGSGGTQNVQEEKMMLRRQETAELEKEIREGYREELNKIEEQIKELNTCYVGMEEGRKFSGAASIKETMEKLDELQKAMEKQKKFLAEDGQKRLKEAQQMAEQSARYQEEIDKNNRDLVALLKSMEEAQKAEDGRMDGSAENGDDASGTDGSGSAAIRNSASQFMRASANHEKGVEEMLTGLGDSGRWFLSEADAITQSVLQRSADIKAALENDAFSDGELEEMMQSFREDTALDCWSVEEFRAFGMRVLRQVREAGVQHIADDPQRSVQETKKSMMQAAAHVAMGEARQSSLDKTSREIAEEVQELIDRRNDIDRTKEEDEEEKKEQIEEQEDLLRPEEDPEERRYDSLLR